MFKKFAKEQGKKMALGILYILVVLAIAYFTGYSFTAGASQAAINARVTLKDNETGERWMVVPFSTARPIQAE